MTEDMEKQIGERIAQFRRERGLTQAQLAERIDVATETISRLERGSSIPSVKTLYAISSALDVDLKDFFEIKLRRKTSKTASDIELGKVITLLKPKSAEEIKVGYEVLKSLFGAVEGTYEVKGKRRKKGK
jgi:transcriptional regulator with XRE-family HTH domain